MKTKLQKTKDVEKAGDLVKKSKSIVFVDFSKTPTKSIDVLKNSLRGIEGVYKVIKKRLLNIALKQNNIEVDTKNFESQLGTVFSSKDIVDSAGIVYRFAKEKEKEIPDFKLLGGYDFESSRYFAADEIKRIGRLPGKQILLGQLVGMIQAPLRSLAFVLDQIEKVKKS